MAEGGLRKTECVHDKLDRQFNMLWANLIVFLVNLLIYAMVLLFPLGREVLKRIDLFFIVIGIILLDTMVWILSYKIAKSISHHNEKKFRRWLRHG